MGCKGSEVRIFSPRPIESKEKANLRIGLFLWCGFVPHFVPHDCRYTTMTNDLDASASRNPFPIHRPDWNSRGCEWGRLLEWQDDDGKMHQWAMPLELLEGDGADVRRELVRRGLQTSSNQNERNLLSAYIKTWPVQARGCCVERLPKHSRGARRLFFGAQ